MLKSITGIGLDAESLIRSWHSWKEGGGRTFTDTIGGQKTAIELRNCQSNARAYAKMARDMMARSGFDALDSDVRDDIQSIAEEMEIAVEEIDQLADPDEIWRSVDRDKKNDITQRVFIENVDVERVKERVLGNRRGQGKDPKKVRS